MLLPGQNAPVFTLPDADMQAVKLSSFLGKKHIVLYFYPRDNTPGCTLEAAEFSDHEGEVCRRYGVLQERETDGVRRECLVRSTFVIDKKGVIRHAAYGVNPKHHAAQIYDVVRKLKS